MREHLANSYEIELSNCYAEIESLRQRVAELEVQVSNQRAVIEGKHQYVGQDFQFRIKHLTDKLSACENERDELFEAMQHPSYEVENDHRAKNQNLFNALMNSTAYSDSLNQRIDELERICRNAYEVYAGSKGIPTPETAAEAYLFRLVHEMKDEIARGLK